jgi:hypothetical protein
MLDGHADRDRVALACLLPALRRLTWYSTLEAPLLA